ncbi:MAG TPA: hypothetical protein VF129_10505 [Actinomycetota bacterium]
MTTVETVTFEGHRGVRLERDGVAVVVTTSVGPRVLGLVGDAGNVLAVLPDATLDRSDGVRFRLIGGHRLWAAPEVEEFTYQPDEAPCEVTELDGGIRVEAPVDGVGLVKTLEVRAANGGWSVGHEVRNESGTALTIAPWAITQVRLGGRVVLPLPPLGEGPQADRSLVLWPYSDLRDPRLQFDRDEMVVDAVPAGPRLKLGAAPSTGRVAYELDGQRFEKRVSVVAGASYADRGAAVQVFLCDDFCELETLGPLERVEPGSSVTHHEHWSLGPLRGGGV